MIQAIFILLVFFIVAKILKKVGNKKKWKLKLN